MIKWKEEKLQEDNENKWEMIKNQRNIHIICNWNCSLSHFLFQFFLVLSLFFTLSPNHIVYFENMFRSSYTERPVPGGNWTDFPFRVLQNVCSDKVGFSVFKGVFLYQKWVHDFKLQLQKRICALNPIVDMVGKI